MRRLLLLIPAASLVACAGLKPVSLPESVPSNGDLQVPVAFFPQEKYQCGPAALAMVLDWAGVAVRPADLTASVYTPSRKGSLQPALITAARRHGRVAYPIKGLDELIAELDAGHPVIVLQNLSLPVWPRWHYAVVIGLDRDAGEVLLHSGLDPHRRTKLRAFMNTWRRADYWGLVVLPSDRLPANADDVRWVKAVAGLEQAGHYREVLSAYRTALRRWPDSIPARMGLANTHYALDDLEAAESAYRQVLARAPDYALAWNNLAQTLADQGRRSEAIDAAERAVRLGGPYKEEFERTFRAIKESDK